MSYYDYRLAGYYFITTCTSNRKHIFGMINGDSMILNSNGNIAEECWSSIPQHYPGVHLDEYVIMPNHVHGIIVIEWKGAVDACVSPTTDHPLPGDNSDRGQGPPAHSIGAVVGSFKSAVSRRIRQQNNGIGSLWQRGYFDHVIRSEEALYLIRKYIQQNPLAWHLDRLNCHRTGEDQMEKWLSGVKSSTS